jgi:glycosyltransferase involved in cell wall biosynthesis
MTLHSGGYPGSKAGKSARPHGFTAFVFRRFDRLIAVNTALVDLFIRLGASPRRVCKIMPYSLPADVPAVDIPPAIEEFFCTHRPVLISMGWLEPEYDFQLQIRALAPVRERFPNAGLLLLGEGRLRDDLQRQAALSSCQTHVLMPGDVPHEVALAAIARSDIFLRTTLYDGDSISVREALHYGTPVIASDNGLRPAGVHLIPKEDEAALMNAIHEIASAGRQAGTTGSAKEENIHAVYELYREIAGISSAD